MNNKISSSDTIEHLGIVEKTDVPNHTVTVRIIRSDNCDSCPVAKLCPTSDIQNDILIISRKDAADFKVGEKVTVAGSEKMHHKAITIAIVIPCILLIVTMTVVYIFTGSQGLAAGSGLGMMLVFFWLLYMLRNQIAHEFIFEIIK